MYPSRLPKHDLTKLRGKRMKDMTRGERISAVKQGIFPPVRSERERQLRSRYGLTLEAYADLLLQHNGACWACDETVSYDLYVDHDHATNEVRGLLCARCNTLVGKVEDMRLQQVNQYLERHCLALLAFVKRSIGTDDRP